MTTTHLTPGPVTATGPARRAMAWRSTAQADGVALPAPAHVVSLVAVLGSLVLPGVGHLVRGDVARGAGVLAGSILVVTLGALGVLPLALAVIGVFTLWLVALTTVIPLPTR